MNNEKSRYKYQAQCSTQHSALILRSLIAHIFTKSPTQVRVERKKHAKNEPQNGSFSFVIYSN